MYFNALGVIALAEETSPGAGLITPVGTQSSKTYSGLTADSPHRRVRLWQGIRTAVPAGDIRSFLCARQ